MYVYVSVWRVESTEGTYLPDRRWSSPAWPLIFQRTQHGSQPVGGGEEGVVSGVMGHRWLQNAPRDTGEGGGWCSGMEHPHLLKFVRQDLDLLLILVLFLGVLLVGWDEMQPIRLTRFNANNKEMHTDP